MQQSYVPIENRIMNECFVTVIIAAAPLLNFLCTYTYIGITNLLERHEVFFYTFDLVQVTEWLLSWMNLCKGNEWRRGGNFVLLLLLLFLDLHAATTSLFPFCRVTFLLYISCLTWMKRRQQQETGGDTNNGTNSSSTSSCLALASFSHFIAQITYF